MTRWPRPDFLAAPPRRSVAAGLLASSGVAALLVAAYSAWSLNAEIDRTAVASASVSARQGPVGRGGEITTGGEGDADARRAARRLSAAIAYPWAAALASLEASTPAGVQWLTLDLTTESSEIRLEGQAGDASSALRVADSFSARPGWHDIALVRLQRNDARDGPASALRFAIEARLDPSVLAAAADPGAP